VDVDDAIADASVAPRRVRGFETRPVAIPDDVDDPSLRKASGKVRLPLTVRWSAPRREYDLDDRRDRISLIEQVLTEGTDDDVRRFINVDAVADLWDELYLPGYVRRAWAAWLKDRRGLDLPC
jgi:hypothetical protein